MHLVYFDNKRGIFLSYSIRICNIRQ